MKTDKHIFSYRLPRRSVTDAGHTAIHSGWLSLVLCLLLIPRFAAAACQMKITFSGYNPPGGGTLTNFPALVVFSNNVGNSGFDYGTLLTTNGWDLRFWNSNETQKLSYEIEQWDPNGASYVWVQAQTIASNSDYIWAKWGNAADTNQEVYTTNGAVWADGFSLVEHMAISNGATVADATAFQRLATIVNEYAYAPTGAIGQALYLARTADRNNGLTLNANLAIGSTWTISSWFYGLRSTVDWRTLARGTGNHHIIVESGSSRLGSYIGGFLPAGSATLSPDSAWHYISAVGSGNQTVMYVDGVAKGTVAGQAVDNLVAIGYWSGSQKFADYLDEFRVESSARSPTGSGRAG